MNSVNINPLDAAIYSSMRFQRAGWLIPLFLRFVCLGRNDLVKLTGLSVNTARNYLDDLAHLGIIVRQGLRDGYVLTVGGKQLVATMLLGTATEKVIDAQEEPEVEGSDRSFEGDPELVEGSDRSFKIATEMEIEPAQATEEAEGSDRSFNDSRSKNLDLDLKIKEEDLIKLNDSSSESRSRKSSENLNFAFDCDRILAAISVLFDASIGNTVHPDIQLVDILAWTAKGWKERGNFRDPNGAVGMICNRIKKGMPAPARWRNNYHQYLPESFLENCGLLKFSCTICEIDFRDRAEFETHACPEDKSKAYQAAHAGNAVELSDDYEALEPDETVTERIEQAWQSLLGQLQMEMPRASFDTWVRGSKVVSCREGILKVGVRNSYARDWLANRLTETVNKILVQILNVQGVEVSFVTTDLRQPDPEESEEP